MIRVRNIAEIKYGQFREFLRASEELNEICREHSWVAATLLSAAAGRVNESVAEFEYPDYATFEREQAAQQSNPQFIASSEGDPRF